MKVYAKAFFAQFPVASRLYCFHMSQKSTFQFVLRILCYLISKITLNSLAKC